MISSGKKRRRRDSHHWLVILLESLGALTGAGVVILAGVYAIGRICWRYAPHSTGRGTGRSGCGNLAQYSWLRATDPNFLPPEMVTQQWWILYLAAATAVFMAAGFVARISTRRGKRPVG